MILLNHVEVYFTTCQKIKGEDYEIPIFKE